MWPRWALVAACRHFLASCRIFCCLPAQTPAAALELGSYGMWDLSSPPGYQTHVPAVEGGFSITGPPEKSQRSRERERERESVCVRACVCVPVLREAPGSPPG